MSRWTRRAWTTISVALVGSCILSLMPVQPTPEVLAQRVTWDLPSLLRQLSWPPQLPTASVRVPVALAQSGLPVEAAPSGTEHNAPYLFGSTSGGGVHTSTGSFAMSHADLAIPGRGPSPAFVRAYNSNDTRVGPLGPGWTHNYHVRLRKPSSSSNDVILVGPLGRSDSYTYASGSYTPPAGVTTTLVHNGSGTWTATQKDQTTLTFDSSGNLTAIADRYGNSSSLTYNGSGQLTTVSDPAGRGNLSLSYNGTTGLLTSVTDWMSGTARVVTFGYDTSNRLQTVTDRVPSPNAGVTTYAYDGTSSRITTITDPLSNVAITNTYDGSGRVATQKDAAGLVSGETTSYSYPSPGPSGTTTVTYPKSSYETTYNPTVDDAYNSSRQLTGRTTKPVSSSAGNITEAFGYDSNGFRTQYTDGLGNVTDYCYDVGSNGSALSSRGNLTRIVQPPAGSGAARPVSLMQYDSKDNLTQSFPPKGVTSSGSTSCSTDLSGSTNTAYATDYGYDTGTQTKLLTVTRHFTDPDSGAQSPVTTLEYNDTNNPGRVTKITPPRGSGSASTITYGTSGGGKGLVQDITDALGNKTSFEYDSVGRRYRTVDANGNITGGSPADHRSELTFDNEDRITFAKAPAPSSGGSQLVSETRYDKAGNPVVAIDPNGQVTKFDYDSRNLLSTVHQSPNSWTNPTATPSPEILTSYTYGNLGELARVRRAKDDTTYERVTDYASDGLGRVRSMTEYPNGPGATPTLTTAVDYDLQGNRKTLTDPLGQITTFSYDQLRRRTGVAYTNKATDTSATADVTYTYDLHGNRLTMVDGTGTTNYVHDELNRLTSVTDPNSKTVGYRYDVDGHRTKTLYPSATPLTVTASFDAAGRMSAVADWASRTTSYSYTPAGNLKRTTASNGLTTDYSYDNARRLTDVLAQDGTSPLSRHRYTLDANGNRTAVSELLPQLGVLANVLPAELDDPTTMAARPDPTEPERLVTAAFVTSDAEEEEIAALPIAPVAQLATATPPPSATTAPSATATPTGASATPTATLPPPSTSATALPTVSSGPGILGSPTLEEVTATPVPVLGTPPVLAAPNGEPVPIPPRPNGERTPQPGVTPTPSPLAFDWRPFEAGDAVAEGPAAAAVVGAIDPFDPDTSLTSEDTLVHAATVSTPGVPYDWGDDFYGQLGDNTTTNRSTPAQVSGLSSITNVAAGGYHSLALTSDHSVYSWGLNDNGQLGDGSTTNRSTPVAVSNLNQATGIAGGGWHSLALRSDGTVRSWGANGSGQLGNGSTSNATTPVTVTSLGGVNGVAAGAFHSLAVKADGTVRSWGQNDVGQLGDGTTTNRTTSVQVSGLSGKTMTAVAAGSYHSLALRNDGTVYAWGLNDHGQLGDGTTTSRSSAVPVSGLTGVIAIAAGGSHSLAVKSDGTIYAWGLNGNGQLGDGTTTDRTSPVQVGSVTGMSGVAGGGWHSLGLKSSDGSVRSWGANPYGQLGDGTRSDQSSAVQPSSFTGVSGLAAGFHHSLAVKSTGTVWSWGDDYYGQLGDGTTTNRSTPATVSGLTGARSITAGNWQSLAVKSDGSVAAWGQNNFGQLGDGTTTNRSTPVAVSGLSDVSAVSSGGGFSLALKTDGSVRAWGYNAYGQLGDNSTTNRSTPVAVGTLTSVVQVAAGGFHSLALKSDGTVWSWGNNDLGQLGDGTTAATRTSPVQVVGPGGTGTLSGVVAIGAGGWVSIAVKSDGTVYAWGWGSLLGNGDPTNRNYPVQVSNLAGINAVDGGHYFSLALKNDGTVYSWGSNLYGQLGNGTTTDAATPVAVSSLTGVSRIVAGGWHSAAVKQDGSVYAWGQNTYGQLGDGTRTQRTTPVAVSSLTDMTTVAAGSGHSLALNAMAATSYTYDRLNRLTGVTAPSGSTSYTYDPVGNRLSMTRGSSTSYSYDKADRITSAGSTSYTVNANGNVTARGSDTFVYDQANRLTSATVGGVTSTYAYDGDGRRISKTVGGNTTNYVYDVNGGLPTVLDDGSRKYVWGLGLADAVDTSANPSSYLGDGLRSVRGLTNANGIMNQTYQTDEFGVPSLSLGGSSQPFGYTGEQTDETGLIYLRARMYDPVVGRFLQRDPAGCSTSAVDPQALNRFSYVESNPVNDIDPSGKQGLFCPVIFGLPPFWCAQPGPAPVPIFAPSYMYATPTATPIMGNPPPETCGDALSDCLTCCRYAFVIGSPQWLRCNNSCYYCAERCEPPFNERECPSWPPDLAKCWHTPLVQFLPPGPATFTPTPIIPLPPPEPSFYEEPYYDPYYYDPYYPY